MYFTTVYAVTSQSFKIFYLYTVTNIYMYCKEGQTLAKMSSFTQHFRIFTFPPQTAKHSLFSHDLFVKKPHITPSIYQGNWRASLTATLIYMGKKRNKLGVFIMTLCRPEEKWPPRIGSLNLFKNPKMFLTKMQYILHTALNKCQGHVAYHILPLQGKIQCT